MNIRIIKNADCGKLTTPRATTLTYNIGVDTANNLQFRVTDNTTGGFFSAEWIALDAILDTVKKAAGDKQFNARIFDRLFTYKSANNAGFLAATLLAEGILQRYKKTKRTLELGKPDTFLADIQPLMDGDISLPDVIAERLEEKQRLEAIKEAAKKAATKTAKETTQPKNAKAAAAKPTAKSINKTTTKHNDKPTDKPTA